MDGDRNRPNSAATIDHQEVHVNLGHPTNVRDQDNGVQYSQHTEKVTVSSNNTPIVFQGKPDPSRKPKDFVVTSCFVIMGCNFIFGLLGWHFGLKSNYAWQLGDEVTARKKARIAMIFVIIGVIVGIATWTLAFVLYFTIGNGDHEIKTAPPGSG